ncbi:TPA: RrF2 family transcriptional regulator [Vibrio parahaemolyticus]
MKKKIPPTLINRPLGTCIHLVRVIQGQNRRVTVKVLSEILGVSTSNIEQLIRLLKKSGLVLSQNGPNGGYQTASNDITVRDVALAFDSEIFNTGWNKELNACLEEVMGKMKISEWENEKTNN